MSDIPAIQPTGADADAEQPSAESPDTTSTATAEDVAGTPPPAADAAPPAETESAGEPAADAPADTGVTSGAGPGTSAGPIPGLFPPATDGTAADPPKQRDALIVIPGLAASPGVSLEDVARRMALAMDNEADAGATFEVTKGQEEEYGKRSTRTVTITRKDGAVETPVVDLYEFDYRDTLTSSMTDKKPIQQLAYMALASFMSSWRLAKPLFQVFRKDGKSKPLAHQIQVLYGLGIFMIMFAYIVVLLLVLGGSVAEVVTKQPGTTVAPTTSAAAPASAPVTGQPTATGQPAATRQPAAAPAPQKGPTQAIVGAQSTPAPRAAWWKRILSRIPWKKWLDWGQTGVVSFTLLGFFIRFNLKAALEKSAPTLACTTDYLGMGARRKAMVGELARLIDHMDSKKKDGFTYRNMHVMGYSFGSIVAIDALFPQEAAPNRRLQRISTLITIGCPFDFVRTYWADYFTQRYGSAKPPRWINVYTEADVLGSNFMDEDGEKGTPAGVMVDGSTEPRRPADGDNVPFGSRTPLHQYPLVEQVYFAGFRVHGQYWDRDTDEGVTCFEPIVNRLYAGDAVLA
jgi:hypothetical protein